MKKTISFIIYLTLGFILPLIGNIPLVFDYKIMILIVASAALIYSQPPMDSKEAKTDRQTDRQSFWVILGLSLLSLVLPILEWAYIHPPKFNWSAATFIGGVLIIGGIGFRYWAIRTLGRFFTTTVKVSKNQSIIQHGPYRIVRHPSYLGAYLAFVGTAIFLEAWYSLPLTIMAMGLAYSYRIKTEEQALVDYFGEQYKKYQRYSWRMVPGVW